ncbi:Metallo-dependent phosphatase [Coniochaeta sp. PMI_546]|nr:Metallo-dependent phosphatase [Coniochaeta sp. PMI_546]
MLRLRRRRNYVLAAVLLTLTTYLTMSRRDDLLTSIMSPEDSPATGSRPMDEAIPDLPVEAPNPPDSAPQPSPTPAEEVIEVEASDLLKEDPTPLQPSQDAAQKLISEIPMSYDTTSRPGFGGLASPLADLPHKHLPSPTHPDRRLVVVGDVHGQLSALESLLSELGFDRARDHLVLAGDMVAKGPDGAGVVQLAMDLGASAVRGNHEDRVLLAHREMVARSAGGGKSVGWLASILGTQAGPEAGEPRTPEPSPGTEAEVAVAAQLSEKQLKWLAGLPIILRMGPLPEQSPRPWNAGTIAVVHAGLVPGVPLEKQDLRAAMNMRSLVYPAEGVRRDKVRAQLEEDLKAKIEKTSRGRKVVGKLEIKDEQVDAELRRLEREMGWDREMDRRVWFPVDGRDGEPWSEVWSRYMTGAEEERDRTVVVYGHDAKAGLRVEGVEEETSPKGWEAGKEKKKAERYAFGLDSGCVYGKQLTALVLEMGEDGGVRHRIVQVDCEKAADLKK